MTTSLVRYELREPAAVLTIDRADHHNSLSRQLVADLADAFRRAADDPAARCVVLTGAGKLFCPGMDLAELRGSLDDAAMETNVWNDCLALSQLLDLIHALPKPTIAAVNGSAVAGGAGLVTVCDLALAVPQAKFGYPEVRRGLVAAMVMPHLLRHVGERSARWMLLSGELIDAAEAFRVGLINAVVPARELVERAMAWARQIAEGGPVALATTKNLLRSLSPPVLTVEDGARASFAPRLTTECKEGLRAFFDKEPPPWSLERRALPPSSPRGPEVVGLGEVLWDEFPDGRRLGGAPFNFTYHCHRLGLTTAMVSRVGEDSLGEQIRARLAEWDIDGSFVQRDALRPTGTVAVSLGADGSPQFTITEDVAYDYLEGSDSLDALVRQASAICFGTLAQRHRRSRETIQALLALPEQAIVIYDVNLRQRFYDAETIWASLEASHWAKFNEEELEVLRAMFHLAGTEPRELLADLRIRAGLDLACLTRGARGCLVCTDDEEIDLPGVPVDVVDTVGAGDAFTAGLLAATLRGLSFRESAEFANRLASRIAAAPGGTPTLDLTDEERALASR